MTLTPRRLLFARSLTAITLAGLLALAASARSLPGDEPAKPARQVTIFGVLASPDPSGSSQGADPKLKDVEPKLRRLLPYYSFRRLGVRSRRLAAGDRLTCPLENDREATVELIDPQDDQGKATLRFTLKIPGQPTFIDEIKTPLNQLVFVDRMLPNKERVLIGLAAR